MYARMCVRLYLVFLSVSRCDVASNLAAALESLASVLRILYRWLRVDLTMLFSEKTASDCMIVAPSLRTKPSVAFI